MSLHQDGLPYRLLAFFDANPGEELTFADVVAKFDAGDSNCKRAVYMLRDQGLLEVAHVIRLPAKGRA